MRVFTRLVRLGLGIGMGFAMLHCSSGDDGAGSASGPFPGGFLGLANVEQNITQCGECHPSQQAKWEETRHAHAFSTLEAIGREGTEQSCAPCHNISDRGNEVMDASLGFVMDGNPRLRNVQCENCHGPGADHIADPSNKPFAALEVNFEVGCGECHQDAHHPFVDEWLESAHAQSHLTGANFGLNVASDPNCAYCHVTQSFVRFIETEGVERVITADPLPITCVACHDPHGNGNDKQLRVIDGQPIVCGQCHTTGDSMIGDTPHHPQRDVLLSTAGFFFDGVTNPGPATHGNIDNNPELCATCHVVTSPFVREGELQIPAQVGHRFLPIPVIDEETGERNFTNCVGCHANPASVLESFRDQALGLFDELESALGAVPEALHGTEAYEGALFNFELLDADKSKGVHNPRLTILLLESSIEALEAL